MDEDLKQNLTATDTWVRGFFMVLFVIIYGIAEAVLYLIVIFQFFHTLLTRKPNNSVLDFSENLCAYLYEILLYISFNSHELPFPFADWPNESDGAVVEPGSAIKAKVVEPAAEPVKPAKPAKPAKKVRKKTGGDIERVLQADKNDQLSAW